ncbi:alpha/beta fold hydrolase, partial [Actinoplanes sp. NPDC026623]|uniref:alpha/beta fold hydrolase n=1 Tax=Actinoplanes sp. NPDC026623 TaxID=3155610 RepID=UPI0033F37D1C
MATELRVLEGGGGGGPLLVLLHGLGGTGDVWNGWSALLRRQWPGRWLAPDLPGHGGSAPLDAYTFDGLADAVAGLIAPDAPTVVLGHSLGGVVGLALAARRPAAVRGVVGLGIKVAWSDEELLRAQALARRPRAWYPTRDEA